MSNGVLVQTSYSGNETPAGTIDGYNKVFTLANSVVTPGSLILLANGTIQAAGEDYTLDGQTITMNTPPYPGYPFLAFYLYGEAVINGYVAAILETPFSGFSALPSVPIPLSSLRVYLDGILLRPSTSYQVIGKQLRFLIPVFDTQILYAVYRNNAVQQNGAVCWPEYHTPYFPQATYTANVETNTVSSVINLGNIAGDSILYQFRAVDFEGDTLTYAISNANAIPGNLSLNSNTGWLSGYINRDAALVTPYTFNITAAKTLNPRYYTTAAVSVSIQNQQQSQLVWNSSIHLGNLIAGVPSTLQVSAESIPAVLPFAGTGASANCNLKLVNVHILNGGMNFNPGDYLLIAGGLCTSSANLLVTSTSEYGTIQTVAISPAIQQYTKLPSPLTVYWPNNNSSGNSNAISLGALLTLNFGIDSVNVTASGTHYDSVTVGFGDAGQSIQAGANATIFNHGVASINVLRTGEDYQAIPEVIINNRGIAPTTANTISYTLVDGNIPVGTELLSNGLLVGIPSTQYYSLDSVINLDNNQTTFDTIFNFTVKASTAVNQIINTEDTDITNPVGSEVITEELPLLIESFQNFSLTLSTVIDNNETISPKTNLDLEFLLDPASTTALFAPLTNENLVPNTSIYRAGDEYFGVANRVRMLVAYGIGPVLIDQIQAATAKYHHNKRFLLTDLQWAQSTSEGYEVIYIRPVDEYTNSAGESFTGGFTSKNNLFKITADTTDFLVDSNLLRTSDLTQYDIYPATLPNMINQLNTSLSAFNEDFLPTWMTDPQPNGNILGWIPAIPLLYVQPGTGQKICFYLQQYYNTVGPKLNTIEAITDRYVWNSGVLRNWNPRPIVSVTGTSGPTLGNLTGQSSFIVNPAIPTSYAANLMPLTYSFAGNSLVTIPSVSNSSQGVVSCIKAAAINGIGANVGANFSIQLYNSYGCPFIVYDGLNSPLQQAGILPWGETSATFANVQPANWWVSNLTEFDLAAGGPLDITTETGFDICSEEEAILITEGTVESGFGDIPAFFEISDEFLQPDEGSVYIKFAQSETITQAIVTA